MSILLGILTFVLVVISLLLIMVVLMQKAKSDGGMGAAMGGGVAEATFGADTSNVLSKATINFAITFFILAIALFLGRIYLHTHAVDRSGALPTISAPLRAPLTAPAPLAPPATPAPSSAKP
jgi:preprotein translocase subunit SecG